MNWRERIVVDAGLLTGKPVVRGMRTVVEHGIELLESGWTTVQILECYPGLEEADIRACLSCAREVLEAERVFPLPAA